MATIYTSESNKVLSEFINDIIDINSNIVIPDLQRPYIWNPNQVILLIDSLFKKWPFGTLLCWNVKLKNGFNDYIPYRPFWEMVCRGPMEQKSKETSISRATNSYLMILDGQQRIQSLLLALGGDSWGFTLTDKEWKKNIEGKEETNDPKNWSSGCICLNTEKFIEEYNKCSCKIAAIDVGKCLSWVITDNINGTSSFTKKQVMPIMDNNDGKYIRFSKIWHTAMPVGLLATDYIEILANNFAELNKEAFSIYAKPLSEFMTVVADVKDSTIITRLIVKDFGTSGILERKNYNNAIVNIFSRLNTAGRALTPQEITLAWLKTGWREANSDNSQNGTIDCSTELNNLLTEINDNGNEENGLQMTMDNLVDIFSAIWIILTKNGEKKEGLLLSDRDLIDGDIVKNIGNIIFKNWPKIKNSILECKEIVENRKLNECFGRSFNAFTVICGWRFISLSLEEQLDGRVRETDCKYTTSINQAFDYFIDRWYYCTQLADVWSQTNSFPNYLSKLSAIPGGILKWRNS